MIRQLPHRTHPLRLTTLRHVTLRLTTPRCTALRLTAVATLALLASGCLWAPSLDPIRREIEVRAPGIEVDPQVQVRLGRLSMGLARSILRFAGEDDRDAAEVANLLRNVNGVEVAVYEVDGISPDQAERWLAELDRLRHRRGWVTGARIDDGDSAGTVLYELRRGSIRNVYVFVFDDESLVLARFRGDMTKAMADAIALSGRDLPDAIVESSGAE